MAAKLGCQQVGDGAVVAKGQPLYELETDKVTNEIESPAAGRLRQVAQEGITYQVGEIVAEIVGIVGNAEDH